MFSSKRLSLARKRRRLTSKALAETAGLSAVHLSRLEQGNNEPDRETVRRLAEALAYPEGFFYRDDPEEIATQAVSFRSLSRMSAKERDAAIGAGVLGIQVSEWAEASFNLPEPDLPDLSLELSPEVAARSLRQHWGLGERPIANLLRLIESKGVRVFALSENTRNVDAFSFWLNGTPFVFLNTFKTAEHSIFDTAHELGHLVMHRRGEFGGEDDDLPKRTVEREADQFASAFLMPSEDVKAHLPRLLNTSAIIKMKARWRVSAMAMAYRLHSLHLLSEWTHRRVCIELGQRGFRSGEPGGVDREMSTVWQQIFAHLWSERVTKDDVARQLNMPIEELESLIFGLMGPQSRPERQADRSSIREV
jgi:Zn-dependent peptidase ImmA (M78 family)